jgi:hypothetical protein
MTFEQFIDLLDRLVSDGVITLAEAEQLLSRYSEFADFEGPLVPEEIPTGGADIDFVTLAILAATLYAVLRRIVPRDAVNTVLPQLTYAQRTAMFGAVQDSFQQESAALAQQLSRGAITVTEWHTAMNESLLSHYRSVAYAGYGTLNLSTAQQAAFDRAVLLQQAYLSRFADNYALSIMRGEPWSQEYIASRAAMYSGAMRGFAYQAAEADSGFDEGWVFLYIAVDDDRTCNPCIDAMSGSPYLGGQGPYPGEVCDGRSRCRCRREPIYDPQAYDVLVGRVPA